jgi:hypothetical protein
MEGYINQVNSHIDDLIRIAITERKKNGIGISFLDFIEADRMDCRYVGLHDPIFPDIVRERYSDRITSVPNSILFFLIYNGKDEVMYEVDLDKNSSFHKSEIENQKENNTN